MNGDETFSELGIPFSLFAAPARLASDYCGSGHCDLCNCEQEHVFSLGIGANVIWPCQACAQPVAFDANDAQATDCASCRAVQPFPLDANGDIQACYQCLRSGRAAFTQDTEFGMVRYEDAVRGLTHGVPGLNAPGYETIGNEDDWAKVSLASERLLELIRTPVYTTWQGERWLICCGGPMTYLGEWHQADFSRHADNGDGQALFQRLSAGADFAGWKWDDLAGSFPGTIYAFHCKPCGNRRLNWDCD